MRRTSFDAPETWEGLLGALDQNEQARLHQPSFPSSHPSFPSSHPSFPGSQPSLPSSRSSPQKGFNDPDMMDIGAGKRSVSEEKAFFTLWSVVKAPLLLSVDLRGLPFEFKDIVLNQEVSRRSG